MNVEELDKANYNVPLSPEWVTVHAVWHEWTAPDKQLDRWRLIVGRGQQELVWAYTYNPALAAIGTKEIQFYRDTSTRLCIRAPKKDQT